MASTRLQASYSGPFAPYPSVGYPAVDFIGAGNMSPRTGAVGGAGNMGAASGQTGVNQLLPHQIAASTPLAIIVVVAVGYIIWHISSRI
jgi:hypothetical protein